MKSAFESQGPFAFTGLCVSVDSLSLRGLRSDLASSIIASLILYCREPFLKGSLA